MSSIKGINEIGPPKVFDLQKNTQSKKTDSFKSELMKMIKNVDEVQKAADQKVLDMIKGKDVSVHEVMVSMERANLSLSFLVEVRNKFLDAYKEITNLR